MDHLYIVATILFTVWLLLRYFVMDISVEGWTSVMVSMDLSGGVFLINLGFIGLYIGKTFDEQKKRSSYTIKDIINIPSYKLSIFQDEG